MSRYRLFATLLLGTLPVCSLVAQVVSPRSVQERYRKLEYMIPMRDGVNLYTAVYVPTSASESRRYPFLMQRTCFGVAPYGPGQYKKTLGPSPALEHDGYIFVYQDVRGRWASEGVWTNMTPIVADQKPVLAEKGAKATVAIDESTDTYDTIEWLLTHVPHHNGRVGLWGISYAGFYVTAGVVAAHPALKAASPQAPAADFFFDDFHHNGAFTQAYLHAYPVFGLQPPTPTTRPWFISGMIDTGTKTGFQWQADLGPLSNVNAYYKTNFFWQETVAHPNYDEFWQKRNVLPHLKNIKPAIMTVGGWFDAEDLYGPLNTYKTIEKNNRNTSNILVMGPFGHGDWAKETGHTTHGDLYFGDSLATAYQRTVEAPFFQHYLKGPGDGKTGLPEAYLFDTGTKAWRTFDTWPAVTAQTQRFYLASNGQLTSQAGSGTRFSAYVSDPAHPVPFSSDTAAADDFVPLYAYMSDDQRFASQRPDVLTFQTEVLTENLTLGGEITAKLTVSTTGFDADWVVKLIDVYPPDEPNQPYTPTRNTSLGNYQQLVRAEVMRSRFRRSFEKPQPLKPGEPTAITFRLQDVLHTIKKGHRLMIQVQSTWFPLIDRNPQTYVDNIYKATASDFQKATHRVYDNSAIEVQLIK
ncbi:CocE/NonD family hydrolase [Fibrella sp. USSR17]